MTVSILAWSLWSHTDIGSPDLAVISLGFSICLLGFLIKRELSLPINYHAWLTLVVTTLGMGNHMWDVPLSDYSPYFLMVCRSQSLKKHP